MNTFDPHEAIRDETGIPGATVAVEDVGGVLTEYNGAGSVVARTYPYGINEPEETPTERVARLKAELKEAQAALRREAK